MTNELEIIKKKYENERKYYITLVEYLKKELEKGLKEKLANVLVSGRAKEIDSLLKKITRKGGPAKYPYEKVGDKGGIRIVVPIREELRKVIEFLKEEYSIQDIDDKSLRLNEKEFGYQAIHCQLIADKRIYSNLKKENKISFDIKDMSCEIQIRTVFQDAWSLLSHILAYKQERELPKEIAREVNSLSALMEIGDHSLSNISKEIEEVSEPSTFSFFLKIEELHRKFTTDSYDKNLSFDIIECLKPLYKGINFRENMENFIFEKKKELKWIFENCYDESIFMSQPEILMIFERIEKTPEKLITIWEKSGYSRSALEEIENIWGKSLE